MNLAKVICVVAAIVAPLVDAAAESKSEQAKILAIEISKAIDLFVIDCHQLPHQLQDIVQAPKNCKSWGPDPYVKEFPKDTWGQPWRYKRLDAKSYELLSLGADGKEGGDKDNTDIVFKGTAPKVAANKSK